MSTCVTKMSTRLESYPAMQDQVADHENRLTAIETLEVKKYEQRLKKLEGQLASFKGWIAGASAVALAIGGLVTWALQNLAGKL